MAIRRGRGRRQVPLLSIKWGVPRRKPRKLDEAMNHLRKHRLLLGLTALDRLILRQVGYTHYTSFLGKAIGVDVVRLFQSIRPSSPAPLSA